MKWTKLPEVWRSYVADVDGVTVMHFQNANGGAGAWRVTDWRGVSEATPKPHHECMSWHRTLADAKRWAEGSTWHLDGTVREAVAL